MKGKCKTKEWVNFTYGGLYYASLNFGRGKIFNYEMSVNSVIISCRNIFLRISLEDFDKYFIKIDN